MTNLHVPIEKTEIWSVSGGEPGAVRLFGGTDVALQIPHQLWEERRHTHTHFNEQTNTQTLMQPIYGSQSFSPHFFAHSKAFKQDRVLLRVRVSKMSYLGKRWGLQPAHYVDHHRQFQRTAAKILLPSPIIHSRVALTVAESTRNRETEKKKPHNE